jgi:hypothetical protein
MPRFTNQDYYQYFGQVFACPVLEISLFYGGMWWIHRKIIVQLKQHF